MKPIIASNNKHKIYEIKKILGEKFDEIVSIREAGIDHETVEDGTTFMENAIKKAREISEISGCYSLADDSGICVTALGDAPGVHSARYCEGTDRDRLFFLLKNMENVPEGQRQAYYVSAIACVFPDGRELLVRGECHGELTFAPDGENGFGYDPIFFVPEEGTTFGHIPAERKNQISHRAHALQKLLEELNRIGE